MFTQRLADRFHAALARHLARVCEREGCREGARILHAVAAAWALRGGDTPVGGICSRVADRAG